MASVSGFVSKVSDGAACARTALLSLPSQMRSRRRAHLIHPSVCPGSPVLLAPHTAVVNAGARGFRGVPCLRVSRTPRGRIAGAGAFPRAPASQAAEPAAGSELHLPVFSDCRPRCRRRLGNSRCSEVLTSPFQTCFPIRRNGTGLRPLVGFRVPEGKARLRLRCLGTPAVKGEREGPRAVATRPADGALRVRAVTSPEFSG